MESKNGKIRVENNKGSQPNAQPVTPSDESLRMAFLRYGIDPDRIKDFIDNNIETNKEISELKKTDSNKKEYCKEQLVINEVIILRMHLEE